MMRTGGLFVVLLATWLLLSGHYTPLIVVLGVLSCAAVAAIAHRMDIADHEGHPIHLSVHAVLLYWPWLILEIIKSNFAVARLILDPRLPISPQVITVPTSQRSELGQVIYANSITLTPGTVSLWVHTDTIEVHALDDGSAEGVLRGTMDRKVTELDGRHHERTT